MVAGIEARDGHELSIGIGANAVGVVRSDIGHGAGTVVIVGNQALGADGRVGVSILRLPVLEAVDGTFGSGNQGGNIQVERAPDIGPGAADANAVIGCDVVGGV